MQPTVNQVHQDAILTSFSVKYMQDPNDYVADKAFPILPVDKQSDKYYTYDISPMFRDLMKKRAPGGDFPDVGWTISTDSFFCDQFALETPIADETRTNADAGLDLDQDAAELLAQQALIRREVAFSTDFMVTGVWTTDNSSATDWDASGGVPITNVQVAQRTVQAASGKVPNTAVMGLIVFHALQTNAQITDLIKYTSRALPKDLGESVIAAGLGVDNLLVGRAIYESAAEGATSSILPILDDDCLVLYAPPRVGLKVATAGMTFVWAKDFGGGMGTVMRVRDERRHTDFAQILANFDQKKIAAGLGYFFTDIV